MRHFALVSLLSLSTFAYGGTFTEEADFLGESDPLDPTEEIDVGGGDHPLLIDICGDGTDDLVFSSDQAWAEVDDTHAGLERQVGKVYFYFNPSGSLAFADADVTLIGRDAGDHFGASLTNAGDIDGDGLEDILIGANLAETENCINSIPECSDPGGVMYVFYGVDLCPIKHVEDLAQVTFMTDVPNEGLGNDGAGNLDYDGDGYSDIALGSKIARYLGAPGNTSNWGAVYPVKNVHSMSRMMTGGDGIVNVDDFASNNDMTKITGEADHHEFGHLVETTDDMNNDGFNDLSIVSFDSANYQQGTVYSLFGISSAEWLATSEIIITDTAEVIIDGVDDDYFGSPVSSAGDFNGDGYVDLIAGAPRTDIGGSNYGAAFIFYGPLSGTYDSDDADVTFLGYDKDDYVGSVVGGGTGADFDLYTGLYDDIIIGGARIDDAGTRAGMVCVIPGGQNLSGTYLLSDTALNAVCTYGKNSIDELGGSGYLSIEVAIGDLNGDGYSDWAIGNTGLDNAYGAHVGGGYLYLGEDR